MDAILFRVRSFYNTLADGLIVPGFGTIGKSILYMVKG